MWAIINPLKNKNKSPGFTIVELLIVIVVIGILAAITIVAYNGVQNRARAASLASDLSNAAKQFQVAQVTDGAYPTTLQASSSGTSYQVSANNSANPQTFCITGTNGSISYMITQASAPAPGGCPGHGQGGAVAITNLVTNPSFEVGTSAWNNAMKNGDTAATSTTQAYSGTHSLALTVASSSIDSYDEYFLALQPGTYTVSGNVYLPNSGATYANRDALFYTTGGLSSTPGAVAYNRSKLNQWQRVSATFTTTTAGTLGVRFYGSTGTTYVDGVMVTSGANSYGYADGSSPNWIWNGTANSSTSTGPAS